MQKFYRKGLQFKCTTCGECCRLPDGKVKINQEQAIRIASYLNLFLSDFLDQYCSYQNDVIEIKDNQQGHCIFLEEDRCSIYEERPLQCKTFPFWPENLKSQYRWKQLRFFCRGIDHGKLYTEERIRQFISEQKNINEIPLNDVNHSV